VDYCRHGLKEARVWSLEFFVNLLFVSKDLNPNCFHVLQKYIHPAATYELFVRRTLNQVGCRKFVEKNAFTGRSGMFSSLVKMCYR
jgi:hypothetical protein